MEEIDWNERICSAAKFEHFVFPILLILVDDTRGSSVKSCWKGLCGKYYRNDNEK